MLQYFSFKGQKFEVGSTVEVKGKGSGVVVADMGKSLFHVRFDSGDEDKQVPMKTMKALIRHKEAAKESLSNNVSPRDTASENKSQRPSIFGRSSKVSVKETSKTSQAPSNDTITELESEKNYSIKEGKRRGSGELPRKDSKASLASTVSPRTASVAALPIVETTEIVEVKKKKPVRKRVLTDVEVRVIERIRKCHENMNGNVFKSALDLSLLQLKIIPSNCHELYYLRELNVRKNEFTSVYDAIFAFPSLTKLDIAYNNLLPAEASSSSQDAAATESRTVTTQDDAMDTATPSISPFAAFQTIPVKLTYLDLSGNNLTALPEEMRVLAKSLHTLIIRRNKITAFPTWFGEFKFLQKLDCADNNIAMTKALSRLVEEELPKLSDFNMDRNPCMKAVEEDQKDGQVVHEDSLIGHKMRYLLQKRELLQSKAARKVCVNRALDIKSKLISMERNKILAEFSDTVDV